MSMNEDEIEFNSRSALRSESHEIYEDTGYEQMEARMLIQAHENPIRCCCCCIMQKGFIVWNILMVIFNIFTSGLFILLLILTYCPENAMMAFAVIQAVFRTLMNICGCKTYKILNKESIKRNNNFLFLFGITAILFTIIFDVVFMVYLNYILYSISLHSFTDGIVEYNSLIWINSIWIIDILITLYSTIIYFKYIQIDIKTEYYRYKKYFCLLIFVTVSMFIWGIIQTVNTMTGTSTIYVVDDGYSIEYYIDYNSIHRPKQMQSILYNNTSIVYVCSDQGIYALIDSNNDQENDEIYKILPSISRSCTSIAIDINNNYLYITEWEKTYKCSIDNNDNNNTEYDNIHQQVLIEHNIESSCNLWFEQEYYQHHGWHFTNINNSNNLCISMGVECNICNPKYLQSNIICFNDMNNPSFTNSTIFADGVRHSVGFVFDRNGTMWFTDHNVDNMGDNIPDCELNKLSSIGQHFGFPYCHSIGFGDVYLRDYGLTKSMVDKLYGSDINNNCNEYIPAIQPLGPHVAPNGLEFIESLSNNTNNNKILLIAEHGSWNRKRYIGYRVVKIIINNINDTIIGHKIFIDGWLNKKKQIYNGRPSHLIELNDGSILISDDVANTIYRVYYNNDNNQQKKTITQKCIAGHIDKITNWFTNYQRQG